MNSFVVLIHILSVIGSLTTFMTVCVHRLSVSTETLSCVFAFLDNTGTTQTRGMHTTMLDWGHKEKLKIGIQGCTESWPCVNNQWSTVLSFSTSKRYQRDELFSSYIEPKTTAVQPT